MICLDTNVLIYLSNGTVPRNIIYNHELCYSTISKVEALGFQEITSFEENRLRQLFDEASELPIGERVVETAIQLRQHKKMSLGDAIVAATALCNDCTLWTANIDDFAHIDGLKLFNPL
jgi:toxin FitB